MADTTVLCFGHIDFLKHKIYNDQQVACNSNAFCLNVSMGHGMHFDQ